MFGIDYGRQMRDKNPAKEASFNKEIAHFGVLEYVEGKKGVNFLEKSIPSEIDIGKDILNIGENEDSDSPIF